MTNAKLLRAVLDSPKTSLAGIAILLGVALAEAAGQLGWGKAAEVLGTLVATVGAVGGFAVSQDHAEPPAGPA